MESIVVQLQRNGLKYCFELTLDDANELSYSDDSYSSENEIKYFDEEKEVQEEEILDEYIGDWVKIEQHLDIREGLHGHSCVLWKEWLYIYGGANHG